MLGGCRGEGSHRASRYVANPTELHWFPYGNPCSCSLSVLIWGYDTPPPQIERPSPHRRLGLGNWPDDDYAVVEDTIVGLIYREMIIGKPKWRWFLQQIPEAGPGRSIPPPNQGMADTLEEAKAAFKKRYEEVRRGNSDGLEFPWGSPLENAV